MVEGRMSLGGLLALGLLWVASCSSKEQCQGAERCACYANSTCNAGLQCRSNLCVANGSGQAGSTGVDTAACLGCAEKTCKAEHDACSAASACLGLVTCALGCGQNATCAQRCADGVTPAAIDKLTAYQTCTVLQCASECSGGGAGGTSSTGGTPNGTAGKPSGTSGSGGSTPTDPTPGDTWLSLVGATAPSDSSPNGSLSIEGVFYAYADPCTTPSLQWDPQSRCLSGELCMADELGENWGAAIGFDLDNRSDVKHAWNAITAGVSGFAWHLSGAPSGLSFWVQNMDPSFNGSCSATSCSINGPPDGTRSALNVGQLPFTGMQKDYWGGGGISYDFDPTNISSLQFKVPATIDPFSTTFELCIDALGVLR